MHAAPFTSFSMNDGHFLCQSSQVPSETVRKGDWVQEKPFQLFGGAYIFMNAVRCSSKTGNLNQQRLFGKGPTSPDISSSWRLRPVLTSFTFIPVQRWSICQSLRDRTRAYLSRVFKQMFQLRNVFCSAGKFVERTIDPGTTDVSSSSVILSDKIGRSRWVFTKRFIQIASIFSQQRFQNSFAEIARLLSEFFRDLDVVPTDVLVRPTSTFFLLSNLFILHHHPLNIIATLPHNIWLHQCHHPHDQVDLLFLQQIS